ncbi:N-acetyl-1-D-myo-inositol-2-amino-2-deoxy-alpha-D-glucopyranoside deacetylase [Arsenicicoccus dermatophilus]|uniref:N-acetyl-1-D-myo-inositol-2-amino-2-deoxy-alpha- D-glucopyranoside deacetylase n=1 Tax=Arsenicicoccus dermatophilus TaxID=1076331 RepID=UPI003916D105
MTLTTPLAALHPRRVALVHAHPDDESLWTGVTIAHLVAAGVDVHVVTCTLGEEGEVIPPALRHLEGQGAALASHRRTELAGAAAALGVTSHVLGDRGDEGGGRWRDSGMAGTPAADHPEAFAGGGAAVVDALTDLLGRLDPDTVITYEEHGGYGHPDHVAAHRTTHAAVARLREAGREVRLLEVVLPRSWAVEDREWLAEHVHRTAVRVPGADEPFPPSVVPDERVTHVVADEAALRAQVAALREHPTQVTVYDGYYALSNDVAARLPGREAFVLVSAPAREDAGASSPDDSCLDAPAPSDREVSHG